MTQSQSSIIWLAIGVGTPLMMAAIGYFVRFLPISILNLPNREYWLAPERQGEMFDYWFRFFLGLACLEGIFMLTIMLLEIQANHRTPPHLSTGLLFLSAGCFIIATFALVRIPLRHFERTPKP
jgi:serine/threonine-protein kinase